MGHQTHGFATADVDDAKRRCWRKRLGSSQRPLKDDGSNRRDPYDHFRQIVNLGQVSRHLAVAVDFQRMTLGSASTDLTGAMPGRPHDP
jgi:hypothetical protein